MGWTRTRAHSLSVLVIILAVIVNRTTAPHTSVSGTAPGTNASGIAFSTVHHTNHYSQDSLPSPSFGFSQFFDAFRQNVQQPQTQRGMGGTSGAEASPNLNSGEEQRYDPVSGTFPGYEDNRGRRPVRPDPKKPYVLPNPPHLNNPGYFHHQGHGHGHDLYAPPGTPVLAIANSQRLLPPTVPMVAQVNTMDDQQSPLVTDVPSLLRAPNENAGFEGGFAAELRQLAGGNVGEDGSTSGGDGGSEEDADDEEDPAFEIQPQEPEFRQPPPQPPRLQGQSQREPEPELAQITLGPLNVYADAVTLSGFSSGGAFVQQLLVSHPSMFTGIGIFQQSFYRCGGGGGLVQDFDFLCTRLPSNYTKRRVPYDPSIALKDIEMYGAQGLIENPDNLLNKRLYIYAGLLNGVFTIEMQMNIVKVLEPFIGNPEMIKTRVQNSQNILPTRHFGLPCDQPGTSNFLVGNCNLDGAYEALSWLYGHDVIRKPEEHDRYNEHSLLKFDQSEFFQGIKGHHHMAKKGLIYIPYKCTQHGVTCLLHAYFHGCRTGSDYVGSKHIRQSGYLEVAERNSIVMLFPQVERNQINYLGCWDSFGNTGEFYATQKGPQIIIVRRMIERLLGIGVGSAIQPVLPGPAILTDTLVHGGPVAYTHGAITNANLHPNYAGANVNSPPAHAPSPNLHYTAPILGHGHSHDPTFEPTPFSHQSRDHDHELDGHQHQQDQPARETICNDKLARDFVGQYLCQDHGPGQAHPHPYHLPQATQPQLQPQSQDPHGPNYNYDNFLLHGNE